MRILLVDDDLQNQSVLSEFLKILGYSKIDIISTGAKAVNLISACDNYGIVLLDIGLPDLDGIAVIKKIRKLKEKNIPIFATSAHFKMKYEDYIKVGFTGVLPKPITLDNLKGIMDEYFPLNLENH